MNTTRVGVRYRQKAARIERQQGTHNPSVQPFQHIYRTSLQAIIYTMALELREPSFLPRGTFPFKPFTICWSLGPARASILAAELR